MERRRRPGSITGGYVVRDASLGDLYGRYLFADFCNGSIRSGSCSVRTRGNRPALSEG